MFDADVPLTESFPGVPTPTPRERPPVSPVRVTKLNNGARVASVDTGDRVSSVGLFVRAGSRYESAGANTGVCSLLEHMAFRGTARRSKFLQTRSLEKTGASFGASASREVLIYSAEGMRAAAGSLVGEIAEAALEPMVMGATQGTPEWDAARAEIKTQAAAMADHPELSAGDASVELNELLHATAYNSVGLGTFGGILVGHARCAVELCPPLHCCLPEHPKRESLYTWLRLLSDVPVPCGAVLSLRLLCERPAPGGTASWETGGGRAPLVLLYASISSESDALWGGGALALGGWGPRGPRPLCPPRVFRGRAVCLADMAVRAAGSGLVPLAASSRRLCWLVAANICVFLYLCLCFSKATGCSLMELSRCISFPVSTVANPVSFLVMDAHCISLLARPHAGMTSLPKADKVGDLAPDVVASYVSASHTPERMVLAASNVDHDTLVAHARKHLGSAPAGGGVLPESSAHYTGGWARSASASASGGGHVAIGFESLSWAHEDLVPLCVLRTLLGGGSSFSSGGPGKGMYTRLYTGVLNVHGWVDACAAFNHVYSDTGLFGISASCVDGAYLPHLVDVTTEQVGAMARVPTAEELGRAKAMTAAALVMDLESRAVLCEDIGRQLAIGDTYMTVEEVLKQVEAVTGEQLAALAARVTGGKPTVVVVGDAYETASYEEIASAVHKQISA